MANELLNPVAITQESLMRLENSLVMFKAVNREFDDRFAVAGAKVGHTVNARMPNRLRGRRGDAMQVEEVKETSVPVKIDTLWGQDLNFSDTDLVLTIDRFAERYIDPATDIIAQMIDGDLCDLYKDVYSIATPSTPGVTPTNRTTYTGAGVVLSNHAIPVCTRRNLVISPEMEAAAVEFGATLFNPTKTISEQYMTGTMGRALGWNWSMDQNVARHTVGLVTGLTPLVNGANQKGATLVSDGWGNTIAALNKGDIISLQGVYGVNPVSFRNTGQLRTFVVTDDCVSDAGGNITIPISPSIENDPSSPFQTVTGLAADNAKIYVFGKDTADFAAISGASTAQGLGFHPDAFTLAIVPLELPKGMDWSERVSNAKIGLSIRLIRGYDIRGNERLCRLDVLGGVKTIRPEAACRIPG